MCLLNVCSPPLSPLLRGIFSRFLLCVFSLVCIVVFTIHIVFGTKNFFSNQAGKLMLKHVLEKKQKVGHILWS